MLQCSLSLSLSSFGWESYMALYLFFCYQNVSHATGEFKTSVYYFFFFFFFFKFYKGRTNGPNIKLKKKKNPSFPFYTYTTGFFFFFYLFCKIPFWNIYFRINEQNVGYIFCLLFYFKEVFFKKRLF